MRSTKTAVLLLALALPALSQFGGSNAKKIYGTAVCSTINPSSTYVLTWNGTSNCWDAETPGSGASGSAGGDLGGSFPNPTVTGLSHVTNASLANSGLANSSTTVNGSTCTLGSSCSPSTHGIAASSPSLDLICAKGNDTTVAQLTITGATNAAPIVFTVSSSPITNGYLVGQSFTVTGVSPSAYNGSYTVGALTGTTITATNGGAPGQAYSSGGTVYMPCNNSSDGTSATSFSTTASIPGGTFGANTELHADELVQSFNPSSTIQFAYQPVLTYNSTTVYTGPVTNTASSLPLEAPQSSASITGAGTVAFFPFVLFSPAAGTVFAGVNASSSIVTWNGTVPQVVTTSSTANLVPGIQLTKQGVASGTYTSGGSISGSTNQTCTLTTFSGMTGTTATVALTSSNTIAGGTALTITNTGYANSTVSAPTSATFSNGTATCSGTPTISTTLGGAQGMAMRLLAFRVWQ